MPIRPEMRDKYPPRKEWQAIRERILTRAKHRCEFCGVRNYATGYRDATAGVFHAADGMELEIAVLDGEKPLKIVLTIAHLDHDPGNNNDSNLKALCQKCHLTYDADEHAKNAAETRRNKRARPLFPEAPASTPKRRKK